MSLSSSSPILQLLIGEELSSVKFVHDYLQLIFHDTGLTVYGFPFIVSNNKITRKESIGYKDLLCDLINKKVTSVDINNTTISINFDNNNYILFDLTVLKNENNNYEIIILDKKGMPSEFF